MVAEGDRITSTLTVIQATLIVFKAGKPYSSMMNKTVDPLALVCYRAAQVTKEQQ
jgi:hypothetical protein